MKKALFALILLLTLGLFTFLDRWQVHQWEKREQAILDATAREGVDHLALFFTKEVRLLKGMATVLSFHPKTAPAQFKELAKNVIESDSSICVVVLHDIQGQNPTIYRNKKRDISEHKLHTVIQDPTFLKKTVAGRSATVQIPIYFTKSHAGMVVRIPVYRNKTIAGIVTGVVCLSEIFKHLNAILSIQHIKLALTSSAGAPLYGTLFEGNAKVTYPLNVADQQMKLTLLRSASIPSHIQRNRILTALMGLLALALILGIMWVHSRSSRELEAQVRERTQELLQTVRKLSQEQSEHSHASESLIQSEERFKKMIRKSPLPMVITGADQHPQFYNEKFIELFGYTLMDIHTAEQWWERVYPDPDYRERVKESWRLALEKANRTGSDIEMQQWEMTIKDGSKRMCEFYMVPLGEVSLIVMIDITRRLESEDARKELERRLSQSQKMEAVGTMSGGIAHDFNNLLSIIIGNIELAMHEIEPASEAGNSLRESLVASSRAQEVVNQLLRFSRKSDEAFIPISLASIIHEAHTLLRASIPSTVAFELNTDCDAIVNANPTQIQQVLLNLCTNAVHAMDRKGGRLSISLAHVTFQQIPESAAMGLDAARRYVRLAVSDTGCGIEAQFMHKLFDPYFTTKEVGKGTGMGLAVVMGIVRSTGGALTVESEHGKGTTFNIFLPESDQLPAIKPDKASKSFIGGSERIIIIDDEAALAKMAARFLKKLGYTVHPFADSTEALRWFEEHPNDYDLVITDMTMPQITGDALATRMRLLRPEIPIIIISGYSTRIHVRGTLPPNSHYLPKPFNQESLSKAVREALDSTPKP